MQKELFNFPKINEYKIYPKNEVSLINRRTNYFLIIIKQQIKKTFSKKNKQLFSEIIQLTLSKTLFYDFYPVEEKGFQLRLDGEFYYYLYPEKINGVYCTTVTLISKIIENLQIDNNGIINCVF